MLQTDAPTGPRSGLARPLERPPSGPEITTRQLAKALRPSRVGHSTHHSSNPRSLPPREPQDTAHHHETYVPRGPNHVPTRHSESRPHTHFRTPPANLISPPNDPLSTIPGGPGYSSTHHPKCPLDTAKHAAPSPSKTCPLAQRSTPPKLSPAPPQRPSMPSYGTSKRCPAGPIESPR